MPQPFTIRNANSRCAHFLRSLCAAFDRQFPGLANEILPEKIDGETRNVLNASTHIFHDGEALTAHIEARQEAAAAVLASDLDAEVVKALKQRTEAFAKDTLTPYLHS